MIDHARLPLAIASMALNLDGLVITPLSFSANVLQTVCLVKLCILLNLDRLLRTFCSYPQSMKMHRT
jgi:hypothetical protein